MKRVSLSAPGEVEEISQPRAIIISYKKTQEHPRINRIAKTLAESGRDVLMVGLTDAHDEEESMVGAHVRSVALPRFRFRIFLLKHMLRPVNALQRWIDPLRWR